MNTEPRGGHAMRNASLRDPYSLYMNYVPTADSRASLMQEVDTWLNEREISIDLKETTSISQGSREAQTAWHEGSSGASFRLGLAEATNTGSWKTSLTIYEGSDGAWVYMKVSNSEGRFVDVPRLASRMMDLVDASNGPVPMASTPMLVTRASVEELIELVGDPARTLPLFVAGSDASIPFDKFREAFESWTRQVRGLAGNFILDPLATDFLREALGQSHAVHPWTIRTYLSGVDPAVEGDELRHRTLGTARLAGSDAAVRLLLGSIARRISYRQPTPGNVVAELRALDRVSDNALLRSVAQTVKSDSSPRLDEATEVASKKVPQFNETIAEGASAYLEQLESVKAVLGVEDLTVDALQEFAELARIGQNAEQALESVSLSHLRHQLENLHEERDFLRELLEAEQLDLAVSEETRQTLVDEVQFLRVELQKISPATAWLQVEESSRTTYPSDFSVLINRLRAELSDLVVFTGDEDKALDLDALDDFGQLVRNSWDCCIALHDYAKSKAEGFQGGFDEYNLNRPGGRRGVGPGKHARSETSATMNQYGDERMFPVPTEIDPTGRRSMKAHFRIGRAGISSPRMYYLDASQMDGRVYIGYLGVHLTNTQTN